MMRDVWNPDAPPSMRVQERPVLTLSAQLAEKRPDLVARLGEAGADLYLAGYAEGWTRARLEFDTIPHHSRPPHDE